MEKAAGLPHLQNALRGTAAQKVHQGLECGSPLPLFALNSSALCHFEDERYHQAVGKPEYIEVPAQVVTGFRPAWPDESRFEARQGCRDPFPGPAIRWRNYAD